jgi:hypothetical protein
MKKNVLFLVSIVVPGKESRSAPYQYGINSYSKWCKKNNVELFVLDQMIAPPEEMKVNFSRYYALQLLEQSGIDYDKVCITDVDSIIHPDCPNFFELTDDKLYVTHCDGDYDWTIRSMENYAHEFEQFQEFDIWSYFNSGFLVVNKSHAKLFEDFMKFFWDNKDKINAVQQKYGVGTDQPLLNHYVNFSNIEYDHLPYTYCMVDLPRKEILTDDMIFTKLPGIYQFNAIPGGDQSTHFWMKKTYEYLYEN